MAQSFDINSSTYAGELALPYIAPAILSADSIANNFITLKDGVKYKAVMKVLSGGTVKAASCDFTPTSGSLDLDERILEVTDLMVNEELCKKDFRRDWEAMQTGNGFINDQLPPNFESFLLLHLANTVQAAIENNIWQGNYDYTDGGAVGTTYNAFDGILNKIVAGTPGFESTEAGAFTADANATTGILTHLQTLVEGLPDAIQGDAETVIYMSRKSLFLLHRAMASIGVAGGVAPFVGQDRPTSYLGYNIIVPAGFPNDTLLGAQTKNLFFGTDTTNDFNQAVVVDMTQTNASDNVRVAMRFTGGCQVGVLADIGVVRRAS